MKIPEIPYELVVHATARGQQHFFLNPRDGMSKQAMISIAGLTAR